jgi:predicted O-methyltransferase YrrM
MSIIRQLYQPTTLDNWERSDKYHNSFLLLPDAALEAAAKRNDEQGLPDVAVSLAQGKFLNLLAQSIGAKKILEVGTLGG